MGLERKDFLAAASAYAANELSERLNKISKRIDLTPAIHGRRSYVYFIDGLGKDRLVLRLEFSKKTLMRRLKGHEILSKIGITVPAVIWHDLRTRIFKKYGAYFFVESFMPGGLFESGSGSRHFGACLGRAAARMHRVSSWSYGWPGELRLPGRVFGGLKLKIKVQNQLKILSEKDRQLAGLISEWIKEQPIALWFPRPRLTTGGFISSNLLINEKDVVILDLARVRYGFAPRDLVQIKLLLKDDPIAREMLFKRYKETVGIEVWNDLKRYIPFFDVIFGIRLAAKGKDVNFWKLLSSKAEKNYI